MSEAVRPKAQQGALYQDRDPAAAAPYTDTFGLTFSGMGKGPAHLETDAAGKEQVVRTSYLLPFEIVSVHLLVVLIGAAYLARSKRRRGATA